MQQKHQKTRAIVLTCERHPRYTFTVQPNVLNKEKPSSSFDIRVGVRRGEDPLLLLQLSVGEELQLSKGLLCQIARIEFSYTGRRAIVHARHITQIE